MQHRSPGDTPFPLKRYYIIYASIGALAFYVVLFSLFIQAERTALYKEYVHAVSDKARALYSDLKHDILTPSGITLTQLNTAGPKAKQALRYKMESIVAQDLSLEKIKLIRHDSITLFDYDQPQNEGKAYISSNEQGLQSALSGSISFDIEEEANGQRFMEVYLPIRDSETGPVTAVLELYDDVSRFETQVREALKEALLLPTLVFIAFNLLLYTIVAKADSTISSNTERLVAIRHNMEKYLSQSAVNAICEAVHSRQELFQGERQQLVIMFSDLRGFTQHSEGIEPETAVTELNRIFQIQADIIHRQGGIIDKFIGDEIMATFPPEAAEQAVTAALDILQAIETHPDIKLTVGIGIHWGEAVVGSLGTPERRDYTAIGDTINTGARLCSACPPDSIQISSELYARLPQHIQACFSEELQLQLKGKAQPFTAHRLTDSTH